MKIGFLPLYIKLYDDMLPEQRLVHLVRYDEMCKMFEEKGFEVERADMCRIEPEFTKAVSDFEKAEVDVIVTVHMAYSPSLESIKALSETKLPIVVYDVTFAEEFSQIQDPDEISYNHGIHGVMDMCSMLRRYRKPYSIAAGYYKDEKVLDKACGLIKAAVSAMALNGSKVARVGGGFPGMGDFCVPFEEMKDRFGITVEDVDDDYLADIRSKITAEEVAAEVAANEKIFDFADTVIKEEYEDAVTACLALRKCLEEKKYSAFSVSFLNLKGLGNMPFMETCKAMQRGIGYAGEGDTLTAAFVGALMQGYPETNFVEIFCPDWKNNTLFLSHMGELNYRIADAKPFVCGEGANLTDGTQPYRAFARMKAGKGVYVNVSRDVDNFQLLIAPGEIVGEGADNFKTSMRAWFKPNSSTTAEFLENHSKNGATHHSIFVYGASVEELEFFGKLLSMKTVVI